jgi:hypothetical protein
MGSDVMNTRSRPTHTTARVPGGRSPCRPWIVAIWASAAIFYAAAPAFACTLDDECDDGLLCNGSETCVDGNCAAGTPVDCSAPADQCMECSEPTGTCSTPLIDGFGCDDGDRCTLNDSCLGGVCQPGSGGDTDHDGYCDIEETVFGCNENDPNVIPPQPNNNNGGHNINRGEILMTFYAPIARNTLTTDPSCATAGVCDTITKFCTTGRIADKCESDGDCGMAPGYCRVVINYADAPDLALVFAKLRPRRGRATDLAQLFTPVAPGCSRKADVQLPSPGFQRARLRLRATGSTNGRVRGDLDRILYMEP